MKDANYTFRFVASSIPVQDTATRIYYTHLTLTTALQSVCEPVWSDINEKRTIWHLIGRDVLTFRLFHPNCQIFKFLTKFHFVYFCYANTPLTAMLISDLFQSQTFCSVFDRQVLRQMMRFWCQNLQLGKYGLKVRLEVKFMFFLNFYQLLNL